MLVSHEFVFEASHNIHYNGVLEPVHTHVWRVRVTLEAPLGADGLAFDFTELGARVRREVVDPLAGRHVNEVIPQPSAENVAVWAWERLRDLPLHEVVVWESPDAFVTYRGLP